MHIVDGWTIVQNFIFGALIIIAIVTIVEKYFDID